MQIIATFFYFLFSSFEQEITIDEDCVASKDNCIMSRVIENLTMSLKDPNEYTGPKSCTEW